VLRRRLAALLDLKLRASVLSTKQTYT
jgi:hypothetical protein